MLSARKRNGESASSLMFRFNKRVKQTGLFKEIRKRRFTKRKVNGLKVKLAALHREAAKKEYQLKKKMGTL